MKKLAVTLLLVMFFLASYAQPPLTFNYQAVVRDGAGSPMPNKNISFKISIMSEEVGGEALYVETHDTITNQFGLVHFHIGLGNVISGNLEEIPWEMKSYYMQIELDENGGRNYKLMNKAELINAIAAAAEITKSAKLQDENGAWYNVVVDTMGNLSAVRIVEWACGDELTDSRDSQKYATVQIDDKCWMAENLNIGIMVNGTVNQANNDTIEKYCRSNYEDSCSYFGGLYQWNEMMQYVTIEGTKGICPYGWHIPTDDDWCTLENFVDAGLVMCTATGFRGIDCGVNLKSTSGWNYQGNGNDQYGYTALPCGSRNLYGGISPYGVSGSFWSSGELDSVAAWFRQLTYYSNVVYRSDISKSNGFSVRCLKD